MRAQEGRVHNKNSGGSLPKKLAGVKEKGRIKRGR